ncbi:MAG: type I restriction enzyme HsdR N-terminal domain-containing protein [Desulforhopalus sp.]|nr:type I restriction enzyme HsdR N-terminal domain-containing protein [Desulforhopalus sp.]
MQQETKHLLSYGKLNDFLTGEEKVDTDDERVRQQLARMLVEEKNFAREELLGGEIITTTISGRAVTSFLDLIAFCGETPLMVLRCAPGSLVSRERSAIAAARVWHPQFCLPLAVVFNGQDAEVLETDSGRVLRHGLHSLPSREMLEQQWLPCPLLPGPSGAKRERELRILNAFDLPQCIIDLKK